jgi:hypothetical protein
VAAGGPSQTGLGGERGVIVGNADGSGACGAAAPCVNDLVPSSFQVPAVGGFGNLGSTDLNSANPPIRGNADYDLRQIFAGSLLYNIPTPWTSSVAKASFGNWAIDANVHSQSGFPVNIIAPPCIV